MINFLKTSANSNQHLKMMFVLLLLTFPFGSKLLGFSIGFMTLYPFLIILLLLFFSGIFHFKMITTFLDKIYLGFLGMWLILSIGYLFIVDGKSDGIVDVRSLGVMFMTSYVVIWLKYKLSYQSWKRILSFAFKAIFILFTLFGILELYLGIHFTGAFTDKIDMTPNFGLSYMPVFLYDNPNTFIAYFLLVGNVILLLENNLKKKPFLVYFIISICFLFSQFALARIGVIATLLMFLGYSLIFIPQVKRLVNFKVAHKRGLFYAGLLVALMTIVFFTNDKHFGPIWQNSILQNAGFVESSSLIQEITRTDTIFGDKYATRVEDLYAHDMDTLNKYYNSSKIRLSLMLNGYYFFMENPIFGIGPGQYRYRHKLEQNIFYSRTNISPHFWLVEIISQFGLIIIIPYFSMLVYVFLFGITYIKRNVIYGGSIIISITVFGLVSLLPSSFLILDIHWFFMSILITVIAFLNQKKIAE